MSNVRKNRNSSAPRKKIRRPLAAPEMILRLTMWWPPLFFACSYLFFAFCLIQTGRKPVRAFLQVLSATAS